MLAVAVLTIYPLYFIVITAFKTRQEYLTNQFLPPRDPTLANFRAGVPRRPAADLGRQQPADHRRERDRGRDRVLARGLSAGAQPLPGPAPVHRPEHRADGGAAGRAVVPLFLFFVNLGLVNSRLAVVIIYVGLLIPFSIYLLVNFFATIPRSLEEAARMDGAGQLRTLWSVVMPLSAPADRDRRRGERGVGLERAPDRARVPAGRQRAHPDRGPDVLPGPVHPERAARHDGRADRAPLPMLLLYVVGQRFFIRGLTAGFGK